jgi:HEAT repeat protein
MGYDFDYKNFGIGLLTGWATAYALYRTRGVLGSMRRSVSERATTTQVAVTRSASSRYSLDLMNLCETTHIAGRFLNLSQILIEPRFIPAPKLVAPPEDEVVYEVFYVVPQVHDHPYLHAPYNLETLSIEDLSYGDHTIALLGLPGSGRTTALLSIALWSLSAIRFDPPKDKVQLQLESEEAALSKEERAELIKERVGLEESIRRKLAEDRGEEYEEEEEHKEKTSLFQRLLPIYVHMANINLDPREYGREIDPAEPLVRAMQYQSRRVTAKTMPRTLYSRLNKAQALVLIDGYDDLPESEREQKLAWLAAFIRQYGRNFVIVAGPASGYGPLLRSGLTPVFLRPWSDVDVQRTTERWAEAWTSMGGKRRRAAKKLPEDAVAIAKEDTRGRSPLEVTLKTWATYAGDTEANGAEGWLRGMLRRYLPENEAFGILLPRLALAAALQLNEGYITPARLEALIAQGADAPAPPRPKMQQIDEVSDEELEALFGSDEPQPEAAPEGTTETKEQPATPEKPASTKKPEINAAQEQAKLMNALRKSGLVVAYRGSRYQFRHPLLASYLASLTLQNASDEQLADKALNPAWNDAIGFAALHTPIDDAVRVRMEAPADVLQTPVLQAARWLAYSDEDVEWRKQLLNTLGKQFVAPDQFLLTRERIAAALVGTRDKNTLVIFRRAARSPDANLRRLSCLAMGALGDPEATDDLAGLLEDRDYEVQLAAAMALGALNTDEGLQIMAQAMTDTTESTAKDRLRQAIAETFAAHPEEGYPLLYDAAHDERITLRRAAVFGLQRVRTPWALNLLYHLMIEDSQFLVKSAAQQAFLDMQVDDQTGPHNYPPLEAIPWFREWVAALGENAPQDKMVEELIITALEQGAPEVQALSAGTIGQLGLASNIKALYLSLRNQRVDVREAAYRALGDLQTQIGQPLPV